MKNLILIGGLLVGASLVLNNNSAPLTNTSGGSGSSGGFVIKKSGASIPNLEGSNGKPFNINFPTPTTTETTTTQPATKKTSKPTSSGGVSNAFFTNPYDNWNNQSMSIAPELIKKTNKTKEQESESNNSGIPWNNNILNPNNQEVSNPLGSSGIGNESNNLIGDIWTHNWFNP